MQPVIAVGLIGVVLSLATCGVQELRISDRDHQIAKLQQDKAALSSEAHGLQVANARLKADIEGQNNAINALALEAARLQAEGTARAVRVLRDAEPARRAIETAGAGPEEMNQWLYDTFSSR